MISAGSSPPNPWPASVCSAESAPAISSTAPADGSLSFLRSATAQIVSYSRQAVLVIDVGRACKHAPSAPSWLGTVSAPRSELRLLPSFPAFLRFLAARFCCAPPMVSARRCAREAFRPVASDTSSGPSSSEGHIAVAALRVFMCNN